MKRIMILTTYFGKFNNYFDLWKNAVAYNNTIDFKLITDNDVNDVPSNMEVIKMGFVEIEKKISSFFDFPVVIGNGYKMSEYQPIFALIFPELVEGAEFWGYCEMDLILGNLRHFFTDEILEAYDKVYWLGHLTLYKNNEKMNHLPLMNHKFPTATYKQAFTTPYNYHFIEGGAMKWIAKYSGCKCYEAIEFADVSFRYFNFTLARGKNPDCPQIYRWINGEVYRLYVKDGKIVEEELSYVHLQKRKMENKIKEVTNSFLIIPNSFIDDIDVSIQLILDNSHNTIEWKRWKRDFWRRYYFQTLKQGGIKIKMDKIMRRILCSRNILPNISEDDMEENADGN